jgi:hypothetical protein
MSFFIFSLASGWKDNLIKADPHSIFEFSFRDRVDNLLIDLHLDKRSSGHTKKVGIVWRHWHNFKLDIRFDKWDIVQTNSKDWTRMTFAKVNILERIEWPDHGIQLESRSRRKKKNYCWIYCIFQIDKRIRKVFVYDDQEMKDHGRKGQEFQR